MQRRDLLKHGAALAAFGLPIGGWLSEAAAADTKMLTKAQPFDYAWLKGQARARSLAAYTPPSTNLPDALGKLDWDKWQSIQFKQDHSLWADDKLNEQVRFFHLGFTNKTAVRMYDVVDGQASEIAYDPAMFDYGKSGLKPGSLPKNLGFGGFRINYHTDWTRDIAAFQGASYFRAPGGDKQYGLSARGLAIDCGMDRPEEFPVFESYWLERPAPDSNQMTVYALLDSPSVAGAYRFVITIADIMIMDIDAALYPRKTIDRLGIAPNTSMYQFGENDKREDNDWRPEIHDSDGLQLWTGSGEWIWRPLVNPPGTHVNSFFDDNPRGFGLLQRDRNFDHYQDDGVFYEKRPSLWVEPKSGWGKGAVMLVESPTADETADNMNAFWSPAEKPQAGQELLFGYKLYWGRTPPSVPKLATVQATRTGHGGIIGQKHSYFSWRFAVDFAGGDLSLLGEKAKVEPVISTSRGEIEITSARPLAAINGWRAMFDVKVTDDSLEPFDLRLFLRSDGQPLTETWVYQWTPPPLDQRRF